MSQSLADSGVPMSSFTLLSSSFLLAGSSVSRISRACWNSLAAYYTKQSEANKCKAPTISGRLPYKSYSALHVKEGLQPIQCAF